MRAQRTVRRQLGTGAKSALATVVEKSRWSTRCGHPCPEGVAQVVEPHGAHSCPLESAPKALPQLGGVQDRASPRFREHQVVVGLPAGGLDMSVEFSGNSVGNGHGPGRARDFGVPHWPRV